MSSQAPYPDPPAPDPTAPDPLVPTAPDPTAPDPLVPPPWDGFHPWFERLTGTLRRSWRSLGAIVLLTFALPQLVEQLAGVALGGTFGGLGVAITDAGVVEFDAGRVAVTVVAGLLMQGLIIFVNAIGWGAGIWAVTREAAGQPARIGEALRAGLRRSLPMFGWFLLLLLIVLAGLVACVLPGIYLFVAGSLFGFVVIYERGRGGIGRSFGLVHRQFSAALGRVLLLGLAFVLLPAVPSFLLGVLPVLGADPSRTGSLPFGAGWRVAAILAETAVAVPVTMLMLVGLLLTYTQLRARDEELTTGQLWAAASQS